MSLCISFRGIRIAKVLCTESVLHEERADWVLLVVCTGIHTEAFQPDDDVALIVHSSYGDHFWERELQDAMNNSSGPAVLFFQVPRALQLHTAPA